VAARRASWRPVLAVIAALPVLWFASPDGHPNELRLFLVPLVAALVLGRGRRFVRDFAPLALGVFAYEWARTLAHRIHPDAFYRPQLDADRALGLGRTPSARLQGWLFDGHLRWHDHALIFLHSLHFAVPLAVLFAVWLGYRPLFVQATVALLATSFAAALAFLVFPAAPPWLAVRAGLLHGVVRIRSLDGAHEAQGTLQKLFDDNPVAAVPSLHAAYSLLVVLIVRRIWPRLTPVAIIYAIAMQFSVVYLGEHYVADLIAGDALALGVWWAVARSRLASGPVPTRRAAGVRASAARPAAPAA
jgi:PAP2 superfamily protein